MDFVVFLIHITEQGGKKATIVRRLYAPQGSLGIVKQQL